MKVSELALNEHIKMLNISKNDCELSGVYCCDLLSLVMSHAFEKCAWITVMSNINSVAVASLADVGCIIIADNTAVDENTIAKAKEHNISIAISDLPVFETGLIVHKGINND